MVGTYLFKRLIGAVVVMWAIITITFMLMHAIPGGPFTEEKKLPPQIKATIEATYHLNDPVWVQYTDYMKHVVQFDLGPSYKYLGRSVNDIIGESFPVSAQLGLGALVFAVIGGVAAGIGSALKPNTWLDYIITSDLPWEFPCLPLSSGHFWYIGWALCGRFFRWRCGRDRPIWCCRF